MSRKTGNAWSRATFFRHCAVLSLPAVASHLKHARFFETRTASGNELFSLITRLHTITFTMLSMFSRLWMINIKMCETSLSWHTERSLPVPVRVSKTRVLKLPGRIERARHALPSHVALQVSAPKRPLVRGDFT